MKKTRRKFTTAFKARVVLEALKERNFYTYGQISICDCGATTFIKLSSKFLCAILVCDKGTLLFQIVLFCCILQGIVVLKTL